ncbi:ABC transporter substrate-binding protein [Gudongella sp. SC589]|jgi:peptide/nickel transport system substrate-binding protein|uniref:ABC transporter substrate-binding protein n=1 Tax=Gudongella sp. SC589 TaxID=3385990 RepID=UPI00390476B6
MTIALLLLSVTGCSLEQDPSDIGEIQEGVDYFIFENAGISLPLTSFKTLNPLFIDNLSYYHFSKLIFEGLFEYDENLQPVPRLASTYTISEDGRMVEVYLRNDVLWHNGESLDSEDVVFTVQTMKRAGEDSLYGRLVRSGGNAGDMNILSAKALSENRVEISFREPMGNILDMLTFPIIPKELGAGALAVEDYIPVGTGPYKFVEHVKFKEVHLESNPQYREGEPQISYITGKIFDNRELILTAFETGKLDLAPTIGVDWDKYEHNERISIYEYVSGDHELLSFNNQSVIFSSEGSESLRKAIIYSIDRQSIIDKVYLQHGTQVDTPVHPSSYLASSETDMYGYNIERAESLLASAGYSDLDLDGVLEDSQGNKLRVELLVNPQSELKLKTAEMIKINLKEVGIQVELVHPSGENADEITENMRKMLLDGEYNMALLQWEQSTIPLFDEFLGTGRPENLAHYSDENMDLLLSGMRNTWDENSKVSIYKDFQEYYVEKVPYGSLLFRNKALLVDSGISGPLQPTYYNLYNGLEGCYLTMRTN